METISGYQGLKKIAEGTFSEVYRAERIKDNLSVIVKVPKASASGRRSASSSQNRYRQEFDIGCSLETNHVVKPYALESHQGQAILIMEDMGGDSLKTWMAQREVSLEAGLSLFIKSAECLRSIHRSAVIHHALKPAHLIYNAKTGELKFVDFALADAPAPKEASLNPTDPLEGNLSYISPEQTGRLNRSVDYRTDFYSLGVIFYELFTGKLPFASQDPMELVHSHIAREPKPPHEVNAQIPQALSNILLKLLAKSPEDRYKSAHGLKEDLEECQRQWTEKGEIDEFPLGLNDISEQFHLPEKLYGRKAEISTLLEGWLRCRSGAVEALMVTGQAGVGKSALVQEIPKRLIGKRGAFLSGKFDQLTRVAYSAIGQAFEGLVRGLLSEGEEALEGWREKLQQAWGPNGRLITDIVPLLEKVVGQQPAVEILGPEESRNRQNYVFRNFVRVFATEAHPLVIFLDDLQWADSASLDLMELLLSDPETGYFLLIGAYRSDEGAGLPVEETHPLAVTLKKLKEAEVILDQITLEPLQTEDLAEMIEEAIPAPAPKVKSLATTVYRKAGGNPFFVKKLLRVLHQEGLLSFSPEAGHWQWEEEALQAIQISDNIAEFMIGLLKKLPQPTQEALKFGACIGNRFDLKTLSLVMEPSEEELFSHLAAALQEEILFLQRGVSSSMDPTAEGESKTTFRFQHDRLQQAAYALIEDGQKEAVHLHIGRLLKQDKNQADIEDNLFEIVGHLNTGQAFIEEEKELEELAWLNLSAGKKAKSSSAHQPASNYLQTGIGLLSGQSWQQQYKLSLALHEEAAEAAYLSGDFERMEELTQVVMRSTQTI